MLFCQYREPSPVSFLGEAEGSRKTVAGDIFASEEEMDISMEHIGNHIHHAIISVADDQNRRRVTKPVSHGKESAGIIAVCETLHNKIGIHMIVNIEESIDNGCIVIGRTGLGLNGGRRIITVAWKRSGG